MDLFEIIRAYKRNEGMDPDRFLALVARLPDDSALHAHLQGGDNWRQYLGWGENRQIGAGIYDLITILARGTVNWEKGKAPKLPPWERPGERSKAEKQQEELSPEEQLRKVAGIFGGMGMGRL